MQRPTPPRCSRCRGKGEESTRRERLIRVLWKGHKNKRSGEDCGGGTFENRVFHVVEISRIIGLTEA